MTHRLISRRTALKAGAASGIALASGLPAWAQQAPVLDAQDMVLGAEDAPVTVIEYASFTCPHCEHFHRTVFPEIRANFIDTGKVRFVLREVYFDRYGLWAGMVARCAGSDRYFGVVDMLFEKREEWLAGGDQATIVENLRGIGRQAGMTNADLDACLNDQDFAKALVEAYQKNATADEVEGTPTFIVNGTKQSNMDYPAFEALLNQELES
jgi:protein-disulfide isomerase